MGTHLHTGCPTYLFHSDFEKIFLVSAVSCQVVEGVPCLYSERMGGPCCTHHRGTVVHEASLAGIDGTCRKSIQVTCLYLSYLQECIQIFKRHLDTYNMSAIC